MVKTKTIMIMALMGVIMLSALDAVFSTSAASGTPTEKAVDSNQFQQQLSAGDNFRFRIRNRFQFQIATNATMDLNVSCDVDNIGDRSFELQVNTTANQKLSVQFKASDDAIGLKDGAEIKTQNKNQYRFREQFMINLSLNETDAVKAQLRLQTENKEATWAYLDESTGEFVTVESTYEDGAVVCETDHFSIWTVIEPEEEASSIDGYGLLGVMGAIGVLGLILKRRK